MSQTQTPCPAHMERLLSTFIRSTERIHIEDDRTLSTCIDVLRKLQNVFMPVVSNACVHESSPMPWFGVSASCQPDVLSVQLWKLVGLHPHSQPGRLGGRHLHSPLWRLGGLHPHSLHWRPGVVGVVAFRVDTFGVVTFKSCDCRGRNLNGAV